MNGSGWPCADSHKPQSAGHNSKKMPIGRCKRINKAYSFRRVPSGMLHIPRDRRAQCIHPYPQVGHKADAKAPRAHVSINQERVMLTEILMGAEKTSRQLTYRAGLVASAAMCHDAARQKNVVQLGVDYIAVH